VDAVRAQCRDHPQQVSADTGFFSLANLHGLRTRGIQGHVPDANLSYELKGKDAVKGMAAGNRLRDAEHRRRRAVRQGGGPTDSARPWWNRCSEC